MKKIIIGAITCCMLFACSHHGKDGKCCDKEGCCSKEGGDSVQALYEKNLEALKASIAAFEKKDIAAYGLYFADDVVFHQPGYGDTNTTKAHNQELVKGFFDEFTSFKLNDAIFLPGIDTANHQMDGSVRYYGSWDGVHKSGIQTHSPFYGTYDFNADHKIVNAEEYFDVGGLMMAVAPKK